MPLSNIVAQNIVGKTIWLFSLKDSSKLLFLLLFFGRNGHLSVIVIR